MAVQARWLSVDSTLGTVFIAGGIYNKHKHSSIVSVRIHSWMQEAEEVRDQHEEEEEQSIVIENGEGSGLIVSNLVLPVSNPAVQRSTHI